MNITTKSFEDLYNQVKNGITDKPVHQVILRVECGIEEIKSNFVNAYNFVAKEWQNKERPDNLVINHGEFLFSKGDPFQFITEELKRKPDSNRALFSMIDMEKIYGRDDAPIPSFLSLQFGIDDEYKLLVSAYFRALEIYNFLPSNIAEICLYIEHLKRHFPKLKEIVCEIYAFKAYSNPDFYCLKKAKLDTIEQLDLYKLLQDKDYEKVIEMVRMKAEKIESFIDYKGIHNLHLCLKSINKEERLNNFGWEILQEMVIWKTLGANSKAILKWILNSYKERN